MVSGSLLSGTIGVTLDMGHADNKQLTSQRTRPLSAAQLTALGGLVAYRSVILAPIGRVASIVGNIETS